MNLNLLGFLIFSLGFLTRVQTKTSSQDVSALNVMFTSLNNPSSQLNGWKANGGDPCGESWEGVKCSGSSVTEIKLSGYGLSGSLGYQLSNLKSVTTFDMSKNNLQNDVPYQLPPNLDYLDLSNNQFSGTIPYSISQMKGITYVNLAHNQLNGQLTDMFQNLKKLKQLDVSNNKLSGELPRSMESLSSLDTLYLQNNQLSGKINVLAGLPLKDLNVENNEFNGWIPDELKDIDNLQTGGNSWSSGPAPPPPPGVKPKKKPQQEGGGGTNFSHWIIIALVILASLVAVALLVTVIFSRKRRFAPTSHFFDEEKGGRMFTPRASQELSTDSRTALRSDFKENEPLYSPGSIDTKTLQKSPSSGYKPPSFDLAQSLNDNEFASRLNAKRSTSARAAVPFTLTELRTATDDFSPSQLVGEGSLGRLYKAKYPDGKVLAVKKIDSSLFEGTRPEEFSDIVNNISKVHHPNIAELVGYCSEQGHNILVYEYCRNGSLHDFLHVSDDYSKPLTWNTRVRIALGVSRAVEYLHEICSPSFVHKNIKSSNILLDLDLNPHLGDYGLANFHLRTSQNLGAGYNAPECTTPSAYTMKSDVYSFGVVMLELLTGRKPLDNSKPTSEQCLVRWATPQLHDLEALDEMVDPALRGLYPPKSVSRFADVIALCVQTEPEFRPPMSEIVQALIRLAERPSMKEDFGHSRRTEDSDY
ncbi:Protein STRUBBELIG-REPTOR FAMILY 5 [Turnera subulata]|uniref:Protein STRUBBELIG-REPTOR FAMILY 5 n=1 Tax=Turnera subulata TaxID=218843 RepID=A0A9Q0G792_9ROSI|nr:Protein STRUBBELIG-REPTOR FAMILY 5 [Turnera subulata]